MGSAAVVVAAAEAALVVTLAATLAVQVEVAGCRDGAQLQKDDSSRWHDVARSPGEPLMSFVCSGLEASQSYLVGYNDEQQDTLQVELWSHHWPASLQVGPVPTRDAAS